MGAPGFGGFLKKSTSASPVTTLTSVVDQTTDQAAGSAADQTPSTPAAAAAPAKAGLFGRTLAAQTQAPTPVKTNATPSAQTSSAATPVDEPPHVSAQPGRPNVAAKDLSAVAQLLLSAQEDAKQALARHFINHIEPGIRTFTSMDQFQAYRHELQTSLAQGSPERAALPALIDAGLILAQCRQVVVNESAE